MPWFRRTAAHGGPGGPTPGPPPDPERARRSLQALEAGRLPPDALDRLRAQAARGGVFTSDLSVGEFAASLRDGWRPRGLVMGSSVFRITASSMLSGTGGFMVASGPFGGGYYGMRSGELGQLSDVAHAARQRAMTRMLQEAEALSAHGVFGVRLTRSEWDWGQGLAEFKAIGTAVQLAGAPPLARPFSGAISALDASKLLHAGYAPVGLVGGACVFWISGIEAVSASMTWANVPLQATSRDVLRARELAAEHMRREAAALGAEGIVGVDLSFRAEPVEMNQPDRTDHLVEIYALGTAVAPFTGWRGGSVRTVMDTRA